MEKLGKINSFLGVLGIGGGALYCAVLNWCLSVVYGQYYQLPQKYFGEVFEIFNEKNLEAFIIAICLWGLVVGSQYLSNGNEEGVFAKLIVIYKFFIFILVSLFFVQIVVELLGDDIINKISCNNIILLIIELIVVIILIVCLLNWGVEKCRNIEVKVWIGWASLFVLLSTILIILVIENPVKKKQYEIVEFSNQTYIVLTEYKENNLVVKFDENKDDLIIDTSAYKFVDKNKGIYKQKTYKNVKLKTKKF